MSVRCQTVDLPCYFACPSFNVDDGFPEAYEPNVYGLSQPSLYLTELGTPLTTEAITLAIVVSSPD
jgi:hypothetical protein